MDRNDISSVKVARKFAYSVWWLLSFFKLIAANDRFMLPCWYPRHAVLSGSLARSDDFMFMNIQKT